MDDDELRREMIEVLTGLGVDAADVPASLGDAAAMASDVVLTRNDTLSIRDIATRLGYEIADVADGFAHLGIHVDDPDAVHFDERDLEMARFLHLAITEVLTEDEGREILHVAATSIATIAEAAVAAHVQGPERRTSNAVENARLNAFIAELGLELARYLSAAFRHHLRQAAVSQRRTQSQEHREVVTLTIGFLDLVGFTSLSQASGIGELVGLVKAFEARAHEIAHRSHTRIVKLIGDEVMIAAEKPAAAAAFVGGMIAALADDGIVPRGGLAHGGLVNIHGDYFGPVVNLAARLVETAVPGEVLVDDVVAAELATEPAGRRMLKGFDAPVRVHTLLLDDA